MPIARTVSVAVRRVSGVFTMPNRVARSHHCTVRKKRESITRGVAWRVAFFLCFTQ